MFIAHLPGGYLLTKGLQARLRTASYLAVGLIVSIFPDIDLIYFYFVDHRQTLHHEYWTHLPVFWLIMLIVAATIGLVIRNRKYFVITTIFFANIFLHLILDTFVGGIAWLYPFNSKSFALTTVPATQDFWVWSFVFHWSFILELAIVLTAFGFLVYQFRSNIHPRR